MEARTYKLLSTRTWAKHLRPWGKRDAHGRGRRLDDGPRRCPVPRNRGRKRFICTWCNQKFHTAKGLKEHDRVNPLRVRSKYIGKSCDSRRLPPWIEYVDSEKA